MTPEDQAQIFAIGRSCYQNTITLVIDLIAYEIKHLCYLVWRLWNSGDTDFHTAAKILVGDFEVCWRAWVLLPHDRFWQFVLAILMMSNIGLNIADPIFDIFDTNDVVDLLSTAISLLGSLPHNERCVNQEKKSRSKDSTSFCGIWLWALIGGVIITVENAAPGNLTTSLVAEVGSDLFGVALGIIVKIFRDFIR
ncbi:hypothetical protein BDP27DRAFT_1369631 [Rhodocollybia butyracea]|uniref:Transmembrane protein n=1 Tax=Rhodocollybia butyracea TaxID=206335 RepID=A0A9P5U0L7_9AGAR|nr:hypothetical protein BDP27DRAFT_1369631 [Rhodocollybia butyracea]